MNWESKLLVFVLFATNASYNPFFALFMQDKGFTALEVGALISMTRIVMLVTTPAVCGFAEANKIQQPLMAVLACIAGSAMIGFYMATKTHVIFCLLVYSICSSAKGAISDTLVLAACRQTGSSYALQRLWGSASWGVISLLIGVGLREYYAGVDGGVKYTLIPLVHAGSMFCLAFVLAFLFRVPTGSGKSGNETNATNAAENEASENASKKLAKKGHSTHQQQQASQISMYRSFVTDRKVVGPIAIGVSSLAISESAISNFIFPYLRTHYAAPPILFSWVLVLHSISEICCFAVGSWLLKNVGVALLFGISAVSFALKAYVYSVLTNAWAILSVEWMHGLCFAFLWTAAVAQVDHASQAILGSGGKKELDGKISDPDGESTPKLEDSEMHARGEKAALMSGSSSPAPEKTADSANTTTGGTEQSAAHSLRQSAIAMTSLWFFYGGAPPIVAGIASGWVVQTFGEVVLFQLTACVCLAIVFFFYWLNGRGVFATATAAATGTGKSL